MNVFKRAGRKVRDFFRTGYARAGAGAGSLVVAGAASAETSNMDVSAVETYLSTDVTDAIVTVGGAVILLAVTAMGFKWVKGMIFG